MSRNKNNLQNQNKNNSHGDWIFAYSFGFLTACILFALRIMYGD
jgi:hypothetical protein